MPRTAVAFTGPRSAALVEEEDSSPREGEVRVRTLYSGISAGTEMSMYGIRTRVTSPTA